MPEGEISCGFHSGFDREVYFESSGYTDEFNISTPLNKSAVDGLEQASMSSNVPYNIKENADLSDAIQIELRVCNEHKGYLKNS